MKDTYEKIINYILAGGFLLFAAGVMLSIANQVRSGMSLEMAMILAGVALIVLGIIGAKIFGEMF